MASIARNASMSRPSCSFQCLRKHQTRYLSMSRPRLAKEPESTNPDVMKHIPSQPAQSTRMKKLRLSEIPTDIGIAPNTYIRPCGMMPSWLKSPTVRAQLEWLYLKQSVTDFINSVYIARWGPKDPLTNKRVKIPMELRERCFRASQLHTQLCNAAAKGDRRTIEKIACSGLADQQNVRISRNRIQGFEPQSWKVRYNGWVVSPKIQFSLQLLMPSYFKAVHIVADRWMSVPAGPGVMMRQVIARVDSKQTLDRKDGSRPQTKTLREYVVIQKNITADTMLRQQQSKDQKERGNWMIWGTVEPTTTEEALEIRNANKSEQGSIGDRLRAAFPGMS